MLLLLLYLFITPTPALAQEPPSLSVEGSGGLAMPGGEATYRIRLLNWDSRIVPGGFISQTLPAGFSYLPGSTRATVGGWPIGQADPVVSGGTLAWGPFQLPSAGHTAHNPYGVHTFVQDLCLPEFIDFQLDQALALVGSGGYVTQLFYRITPGTAGPDPCAVYFVNAAYDRNLVPILRLQGVWNPVGFWEKPDPGPGGDYAPVAEAFARYVAGLPRRNTHPLYITVWNEPDLWVEWSGRPSASEYGRFFVAVSRAIRRLDDPHIRILNGAVTPANTRFIRGLLAVPDFVTAFDAWASHCYPYNHPPWYNIHRRTARYGNTVIDCYIEERDVIARYGGRAGFKFVVKETGHGLGDNVYAFEGFPRINEINRADYIASAFRDYWRTWPEVIATTPFELGDPWSGWEWLDWVDYRVSLDPFAFNYTPHRQYNIVSSLPKPRGQPVPHGIEITFRTRVAKGMPLGTYTSELAGSAMGAIAVLTQAVPVRLVERIERFYFPLVRSSSSEGVWYMAAPDAGPASYPPEAALRGTDLTLWPPSLPGKGESNAPFPTREGQAARPQVPRLGESGWGWGVRSEGDGAIIPTHFLAPRESGPGVQSGAVAETRGLFDGTEPRALVLDAVGGRAHIGLAGGDLAVLDMGEMALERRIPLGAQVGALALGPQPGLVYAGLTTGEIVLIDVSRAVPPAGGGEVAARLGGLGYPTGLAFDPGTGSLLVADAEEGRLVRLSGDLSTRLGTQPLADLPGQLLLDSPSRRLYVMLPGARRVLALDADTLRPVAEAQLPGGPLIQMELDIENRRLYVLGVLSPRYRGVSVLGAGDLSLLALVAESPLVPLRRAGALAVSSGGRLWLAEGNRLYRIAPEDFALVEEIALEEPVVQGGLAADAAGGRLVGIGPSGIFAR